MKYIKGSDFKLTNTSVTFGKFDGLHLGHGELINNVINSEPLKSVFFTFDLNPLSLFSEKEIKLIYTEEEKKEILSKFQLDYVVRFPFTKETANMEAEDFIEKIIFEKLGAKRIVVGEDFCFGKGRKGDVHLLNEMSEKFGYSLKAIPKLRKNGDEISSTGIRKLIKNGEMQKANSLLGRYYSIISPIIHGKKLGHTVGMPTINQKPANSKLLPPFGVYASFTKLDGKVYKGITNIGVKPTIGESFIGVETWLFDFNQDVYGKMAEVCILEFIRPEIRFASLDDLKFQVDYDAKKAKECLEKYSMEVE